MAAPGKPYGLIFPKKGAQKTLVKHSVFMDDSDEEASVGESLQREALKKQAMKQTKLEIQRALAEDSTVYEYDAIYEDIQQKKADSHASSLAEKAERKPRYIQNILQAATLRKKEQEKRMEKKIQKERETEGDAFDDKEAFVTSAYKKKLQERAEEEERERREAAAEACLDVTKQKDLSGFYRHLLNQAVGEEKMPHCSLRDARLKGEDLGEKPPSQSSRILEERARACLPVRGVGSTDKDREFPKESSEGQNSPAEGTPDSRRGDERGARSGGSDHGQRGSKPRRGPRESRSSGEEGSCPSDQAEQGDPRRKSKSSRERRAQHPAKAEREQPASRPRRRQEEEAEEEGGDAAEKDSKQQGQGRRIKEEGPLSSPEEPPEAKHKPAEDRKQPAEGRSKFARRSNQESVSSARDRYLARQVARGGSRPYVEKEED